MIDENVEGGVMSQEGPNLVGLGGDKWGRQLAEPQLLRSENRKDTKEWAEDEVMKDPRANILILILCFYYVQKFGSRFIMLHDIFSPLAHSLTRRLESRRSHKQLDGLSAVESRYLNRKLHFPLVSKSLYA
jgi:hypothetical protein